MKVQDFDINAHSSIELVEFFERLETAEQIWHNASGEKATANQTFDSQNSSKVQNGEQNASSKYKQCSRSNRRGQKRPADHEISPSSSNSHKSCRLHGENVGHTTDDCMKLRELIDKDKEQWKNSYNSKKPKPNNYERTGKGYNRNDDIHQIAYITRLKRNEKLSLEKDIPMKK
eukprot:scaffold268622_cov51-Attheya_sp.AAC.1